MLIGNEQHFRRETLLPQWRNAESNPVKMKNGTCLQFTLKLYMNAYHKYARILQKTIYILLQLVYNIYINYYRFYFRLKTHQNLNN